MEWNCFWAEYKDFWPLLCQTLPHRNTPTGNGGYMVRQTWNGKCEFLLHPDTGHPPFYRVPPQTRPDGRPSAASIKTELKAAYPHAFSEEEMERFFHECDSIIPCKGGRMAYASELRRITCPYSFGSFTAAESVQQRHGSWCAAVLTLGMAWTYESI